MDCLEARQKTNLFFKILNEFFKAIPRTGTSSTSSTSTSFMGGGGLPFMPIKMNEGRTSAGTPVIGSGAGGGGGHIGTPNTPTSNPFTLFQQRDQIMRNLRSTPGNEFRSPDFRNLSHLHSGSPSHGNVDFGGLIGVKI